MLFKSNKLISFFKFSVLFDDKLLLLFFSFDLNLNFFFGINKHSFDDNSDINILDIISSVNSSIFIFCGVIIFLDFFSSAIFSGSNSGILLLIFLSFNISLIGFESIILLSSFLILLSSFSLLSLFIFFSSLISSTFNFISSIFIGSISLLLFCSLINKFSLILFSFVCSALLIVLGQFLYNSDNPSSSL